MLNMHHPPLTEGFHKHFVMQSIIGQPPPLLVIALRWDRVSAHLKVLVEAVFFKGKGAAVGVLNSCLKLEVNLRKVVLLDCSEHLLSGSATSAVLIE